MLTKFHGNLAPGPLIGGFMVDAAVKRMTEYEFFDAICESASCLPDAIQILTPCTVGNGWLKIVNMGHFAITLYDKRSGDGIRVSMDVSKLDQYPEIRNWFMRLSSKQEQDKDALISEIHAAGYGIFSIKPVTVSPGLRGKHAAARAESGLWRGNGPAQHQILRRPDEPGICGGCWHPSDQYHCILKEHRHELI